MFLVERSPGLANTPLRDYSTAASIPPSIGPGSLQPRVTKQADICKGAEAQLICFYFQVDNLHFLIPGASVRHSNLIKNAHLQMLFCCFQGSQDCLARAASWWDSSGRGAVPLLRVGLIAPLPPVHPTPRRGCAPDTAWWLMQHASLSTERMSSFGSKRDF